VTNILLGKKEELISGLRLRADKKINKKYILKFNKRLKEMVGRDSSVGIAIHCGLDQCFSTAGPRPGTGPWHQLYRVARDSPGICHFSFLSIFHE
jgi:hypothetical protein